MQQLIGLAALAFGASWIMDERRKKMPAVQGCFERFHDRIRLSEDDDNAKLREKREIILDTLQRHLSSDVPKFEHFHQGSYAMHTGTVPPDGDYDIDVGLVFDCVRSKYGDPVALKAVVRNALARNVRMVSIRRACVTAYYSLGSQSDYHVDLAIYVKRADGLLDIAKGKEYSRVGHRFWEKSDPKGLTKALSNRFRDGELQQYRRCIRYLKRWRDVQFSSGAPISIALTVAAYRWFKPCHQVVGGAPNDLLALRRWTRTMLDQFTSITTAEGNHRRLCVVLPVEPRVDVLEKMTNIQMARFETALASLHQSLNDAYERTAAEECTYLLAKQFGIDFS